MSRATPDDQLKFLLSCVRYSNNGKIDFVEVARECGVVSKGAAAKRYERLLKANGIHPNGGVVERSNIPTPFPTSIRQKSKVEIARSAAAKRRKIEGECLENTVDNEDGYNTLVKAEATDTPYIKSEPGMGSYHCNSMYTSMDPPQQSRLQMNPFSTIQSYNRFPPSIHPRYGPSRQSETYRPAVPPYTHAIYPPMSSIFQPPAQSIDQSTVQSIQPSETITSTQPPTPAAVVAPAASEVAIVPEHEIQSMYEEFCSQDIFKTSEFDWSSSTKAPTTDTISAVTATTVTNAPFSKPQSSPHTEEVLAATSSDLGVIVGGKQGIEVVPESFREDINSNGATTLVIPAAVATTSAAAVPSTTISVPQPTGKTLNDSIMIID